MRKARGHPGASFCHSIFLSFHLFVFPIPNPEFWLSRPLVELRPKRRRQGERAGDESYDAVRSPSKRTASRTRTVGQRHFQRAWVCPRTTAVTGPPPKDLDFKTRMIGGSRSLYARHGRELVGCKSPVRKRELIGGQYTKCKPTNKSTRRGQLRKGDRPWEGSLRMCWLSGQRFLVAASTPKL